MKVTGIALVASLASMAASINASASGVRGTEKPSRQLTLMDQNAAMELCNNHASTERDCLELRGLGAACLWREGYPGGGLCCSAIFCRLVETEGYDSLEAKKEACADLGDLCKFSTSTSKCIPNF